MYDLVEELRKPWVENNFIEDIYKKFHPYVNNVTTKNNKYIGKNLCVIKYEIKARNKLINDS